MKLARNLFLMLAVAASLTACDDDDDPTDPNNGGDPIAVADLAGEYTVSSFTYITDETGDQTNLTPMGLGVTDLAVASDGSFDGTLIFPTEAGNQSFELLGDIELSNTTETRADITVNFEGAVVTTGVLSESEAGFIELSGNTLTMTLTEVTVPTGPAAGADANLVMVATRN